MSTAMQFFPQTKADYVKKVLQAGLRYVYGVCVHPTSNKMSDLIKSNGWNLFPQFRYRNSGCYIKRPSLPLENNLITEFKYIPSKNRQVFFLTNKQWHYRFDNNEPTIYLEPKNKAQAPLDDAHFFLTVNQETMLAEALFTLKCRSGNCQARSSLLAKYLWEHSKAIDKIELVQYNFDHTVLVVNRKGDIKNPSTWGNDAFIVDAWFGENGLVYPASEFIARSREANQFIISTYKEQNQVGVYRSVSIVKDDAIAWSSVVQIFPQTQSYPTYSKEPFVPLEDYYEVLNAYTSDLISGHSKGDKMDKALKEHQEKFKHCLEEIRVRPRFKA